MKGKAEISGDETHVPSIRQIAVARAYVQGLEIDRGKLHKLEEVANEQTWEIVKLGSYNRALHRALTKIMTDLNQGRFDPDHWSRTEDLLGDVATLYDVIFPCACGHSKWDHDQDGCLYLTCKAICG